MAAKKNTLAEAPACGSKEAGFCVYIGPTIVGVVQNGTIYQGDKRQVIASPELAPALEKYPLAADLLIAGEQLAESRQQVKQPGNLLYNKYQQLQKQAVKQD